MPGRPTFDVLDEVHSAFADGTAILTGRQARAIGCGRQPFFVGIARFGPSVGTGHGHGANTVEGDLGVTFGIAADLSPRGAKAADEQ